MDVEPLTSYQILINLYELPSSTSLFNTASANTLKLPTLLERELSQLQPRLTLPRTFWQNLPSHSHLDLSDYQPPPPPLPTPFPSSSISDQNHQQQSDFWSPPSYNQPLEPDPDHFNSHQDPILDFRFGPISIDWVDYPVSHSPLAQPPLLDNLSLIPPPLSPPPTVQSSTLFNPPTPLPMPTDPQQQPWQLSTATSPRPSSSSATLKRSPPSSNNSNNTNTNYYRPPEKSGSTDLYWGTVHLYKELGATDDPTPTSTSGANGKQPSTSGPGAILDLDDGTVVGMVAVPGNVNAATLLQFVQPALESIVQLRILRDSTPNRTIVLIRFREANDAQEFRVMFNGKPYYDTKDSEVCRVVPISSIKLKTSSIPPFTFPYSTELEPAVKNAVELPTCPVCLERMDGSITGLITVVCQHSFHCNCLLKWGDSRCPVCRSTNYRTRSKTISEHHASTMSTCTVCQSTSNLWICLVCGNVGCGRYQGGHAYTHFTESGHSYCMELETQRVWDYVTDAYVHRLIRNRADGRVVELPTTTSSASSSATAGGSSSSNGKEKEKDKDRRGPDREAELEQDKLEAMGVEYAKLMTAQLDEQRRYYEEEVGRAKDELGGVWRKLEDSEEGRRREGQAWETRFAELETAFARERKMLEGKMDAVVKEGAEEEVRRKKDKLEQTKQKKELERELAAERAVAAGLAENVLHLKGEVAKREEETKKLTSEVADLQEQMRDVMFALSARDQIEAEGGAANEAAGGDVIVPTPQASPASRRRRKK
ncbi:hypothetical protein T439DRAFT_325737 [Meredithblackwellia eburnea MCA 4105]